MLRARGKAKAKAATAKAKAKARAARVSHNQRRDRRRAAVRELNSFADATGARPIPAKTATAKDVEQLVRVLQRRTTIILHLSLGQEAARVCFPEKSPQL